MEDDKPHVMTLSALNDIARTMVALLEAQQQVIALLTEMRDNEQSTTATTKGGRKVKRTKSILDALLG